jgi:hypothetical protein
MDCHREAGEAGRRDLAGTQGALSRNQIATPWAGGGGKAAPPALGVAMTSKDGRLLLGAQNGAIAVDHSR